MNNSSRPFPHEPPLQPLDLAERVARLAVLRRHLGQREGARGRKDAAVWPTGLPAIDALLPEGGLLRGAVHEVIGSGPGDAAAEGFAAALAARIARHGPVLWCLSSPDLYGPGLIRQGLSPNRLILVRAHGDAELLWAMEEGLHNPRFVMVLGEPRTLDLTRSRRLQLAAEASGVTCLVLNRGSAAKPLANAAVTRWRVSAVPSHRVPLAPPDGPAGEFSRLRARWRVELLRCRGLVAAIGTGEAAWLVEEGDASGALLVALPVVDRPATSPAPPPVRLAGRSAG